MEVQFFFFLISDHNGFTKTLLNDNDYRIDFGLRLQF